ncbi:MAG: diaminopimelate epimerase [Coriobacteriia bacterium]
MDLRFTKMHGLGNDFIVIEDLRAEIDLDPEAAVWLCDRNFGVGADGVILVRPAAGEDADFSWVFFNADGTQPESCGNGIRCFARFVSDEGLVPAGRDTLTIETLGGPRSVSIVREPTGVFAAATVDMGEPVPGDPLESDVAGTRVTSVSMGNPHAVIFVDDVDTAPVETVGPVVETDPAFPRRTNVEFAHVVSSDRIRLRVWERGVGETLACGTGACAALVAAALAGLTGREATIELPGGDLVVRWGDDGHVLMTGPATTVFEGLVTVEEE